MYNLLTTEAGDNLTDAGFTNDLTDQLDEPSAITMFLTTLLFRFRIHA